MGLAMSENMAGEGKDEVRNGLQARTRGPERLIIRLQRPGPRWQRRMGICAWVGLRGKRARRLDGALAAPEKEKEKESLPYGFSGDAGPRTSPIKAPVASTTLAAFVATDEAPPAHDAKIRGRGRGGGPRMNREISGGGIDKDHETPWGY